MKTKKKRQKKRLIGLNGLETASPWRDCEHGISCAAVGEESCFLED